ncbi:hypothetical protein [Halovivax limisalsi]|uniref:hypothetical protein n=1 Tax=Halovivax limisalsi TaxID=1453760 RepID=UPI001FFC56E9|nr:hypothetical protein [Halovivax limisalsi]
MVDTRDHSTRSGESRDDRAERAGTARLIDRRTVLGSIAATGVLGGGVGNVAAGTAGGYPPAGITEWGPSVSLGNGAVRTFTIAPQDTAPSAHGVLIDRAALEGLPSAAALEAGAETTYTDKYGRTGEALRIHHAWSLAFFVPFPSTRGSSISFLGFGWNPNGHPPAGVWSAPHFDVHFHMSPAPTVDAISGPAAPEYTLPARYVPDGYVRGPVVDERVITDMGEHLVDPTAPELNGGDFSNTLIWGVADPDGDDIGELTFVEPMITRSFLQDHTAVDRRDIAQPDAYARSGRYPTAYAVRDVPSRDAIAVTIDRFVSVDGDA